MSYGPVRNPTVKSWRVRSTITGDYRLNLEYTPHRFIKYRWGFQGRGRGVSFHLTPWGAFIGWCRWARQPVGPQT